MLATYMRRMRNSNLEIRIARSSCRAQLAFWKKKTIGIIFNWDISTTHRPPPAPAPPKRRTWAEISKIIVVLRL